MISSVHIVEFKSQSDQFDEIEYIKNSVRTELLFLQNIGANFENTLNLIVTVRYPQRFLDYMSERGFEFVADDKREWLLRSHIGLQEVVIVVINLLPLEEKYADWLIFLAADNSRWPKMLRYLAEKH